MTVAAIPRTFMDRTLAPTTAPKLLLKVRTAAPFWLCLLLSLWFVADSVRDPLLGIAGAVPLLPALLMIGLAFALLLLRGDEAPACLLALYMSTLAVLARDNTAGILEPFLTRRDLLDLGVNYRAVHIVWTLALGGVPLYFGWIYTEQDRVERPPLVKHLVTLCLFLCSGLGTVACGLLALHSQHSPIPLDNITRNLPSPYHRLLIYAAPMLLAQHAAAFWLLQRDYQRYAGPARNLCAIQPGGFGGRVDAGLRPGKTCLVRHPHFYSAHRPVRAGAANVEPADPRAHRGSGVSVGPLVTARPSAARADVPRRAVSQRRGALPGDQPVFRRDAGFARAPAAPLRPGLLPRDLRRAAGARRGRPLAIGSHRPSHYCPRHAGGHRLGAAPGQRHAALRGGRPCGLPGPAQLLRLPSAALARPSAAGGGSDPGGGHVAAPLHLPTCLMDRYPARPGPRSAGRGPDPADRASARGGQDDRCAAAGREGFRHGLLARGYRDTARPGVPDGAGDAERAPQPRVPAAQHL